MAECWKFWIVLFKLYCFLTLYTGLAITIANLLTTELLGQTTGQTHTKYHIMRQLQINILQIYINGSDYK